MTPPQTTEEIKSFYTNLMRDTARGALASVCQVNGISLEPKLASELKPIPVYECGGVARDSLLKLANERCLTDILWPTSSQFEFVQAYWKRYKVDRRPRNEIVITASNYCWARFYAAKELMHCFIDDDGYPASNTISLVNDLIDSLATHGYGRFEDCKPQTIIDELAWYGACEYLVPASWLPAMSMLQQKMTEEFPTASTYLHIARLIRAPEPLVRHRLARYRAQ